MARNLVLLIGTVGVFALLFFGYSALVKDPELVHSSRTGGSDLPEQDSEMNESKIEVMIQGDDDPITFSGKEWSYTEYDDTTGRVERKFRGDGLRKLPEGNNLYQVFDPSATILLPNGQQLSITADEGRFSGEVANGDNIKAMAGVLLGEVKIVYDRSVDWKRLPVEQRPDDAIIITMKDLSFDEVQGQLKTDEPIRVESTAFVFEGEGLELVWDEIANKLTMLRLHRNGRLTYFGGQGFNGLISKDDDDEASAEDAELAPLEDDDNTHDRLVEYVISLDQAVRVSQVVDARRVGGLVASLLEFHCDIGGNRRPKDPKRVANKQDDKEEAEDEPKNIGDENNCYVVEWNGSLTITPRNVPEGVTKERRRLVAEDVVVDKADGTELRCGRLEYREDTEQAWLSQTDDGYVAISLDDGVFVTAQSAYFDIANNTIKLIGDVWLIDRGRDDVGMEVHASNWAELLLADPGESKDNEASDNLIDQTGMDSARLKEACFDGDVTIAAGNQHLAASRINLYFNTDNPDLSVEESFECAIASGGVVLTVSQDGWFEQVSSVWVAGLRKSFGGNMPGRPGVEQSLRCEELKAMFVPTGDGHVRVVEVKAMVGVDLVDYEEEVAAKGRQLVAAFGKDGRLTEAKVLGSADKPAWAFAQGMGVWGEKIKIWPEDQLFTVPGEARVVFRSGSGLFGRKYESGRVIDVKCHDSLICDGSRDYVLFSGDVEAKSEGEEMLAKTLKLQLEDVPLDEQQGETGGKTWGQLAAAFHARGQKKSTGGLFEDAAPSKTLKKDVVMLIAVEASISSTMYGSDPNQPTSEIFVESPVLNVDFVKESILTGGPTEFLMASYCAAEDSQNPGDESDPLSALVGDGPSQTRIESEGPMTYMLPKDGSKLHAMLLEGKVSIIHCSGAELLKLDEWRKFSGLSEAEIAEMRGRVAWMNCSQLTCMFEENESGSGPSLNIADLTAKGDVVLVDRVSSPADIAKRKSASKMKRTIEAGVLQFYGQSDVLKASAPEGQLVTITIEDLINNTISQPVKHPASIDDPIKVNLLNGKITGFSMPGGVRGEWRRSRSRRQR